MLNQETLQHKAILSLSKAEFEGFILRKMYKINKNFDKSKQCIVRLTYFIKNMPFNKQSIKIAKNIIKYYGVGIMIFFQAFYQKVRHVQDQINILKKNNNSRENQDKIQQLQKLIVKCKQITLISQKIIEPFRIKYLDFIDIFGDSQKQLKISSRTVIEQQYIQYLAQVSQKYRNSQQKQTSSQLKNFLNQLRTKKMSRQFNIIQLLNLEQLENKLKTIIQKKQSLESQKNQNAKNPKILKQNLSKIPLCCRQYFLENQPILLAQSVNLQYKNFRFPYDAQRINVIRRTICGFLNGSGGTILIGIYESAQTKKKFVKGQFYSESKKQKVLTEFRFICDQIQPKIVNSQMYIIKFVPIKSDNGQYVKGKYVIRIQIKVGSPQNLYSYYNDGQNTQILAFRTANQILKRSLNQDILKLYRQRLQTPQKYTVIHSGDCLEPEIGTPIFSQKYQQQEECKIEQMISIQLEQKRLKQQRDKAIPQNCQSSSVTQSSKDKNDGNDQNSDCVSSLKAENSLPDQKRQKKWVLDQDQEDYKKKKSLQRKLRQIEQKQKQNQKLKMISFKKKNPNIINQLKASQNNVNKAIQGELNGRIQKKYKPKYTSNTFTISKTIGQYIQKCQPEHANHFHQKQYLNKKQQSKDNKQNLLQYLFLGIPFQQIQKISKEHDLPLAHKPIKCKSDEITWLKLQNSKLGLTKIQSIKQVLKLKKIDHPKLQLTFVSNMLITSLDQFKTILRLEKVIKVVQKQDNMSLFIFQDTYVAIKAFLKCWSSGQRRIRFSRDRKKQENQRIMNILK